MEFKSFTKKHSFSEDVLIRNFPAYMTRPIANWIWQVLNSVQLAHAHVDNRSIRWLDDVLLDNLQLHFREVFPRDWNRFISFIYSNSDRTSDFIAFCLQNFTNAYYAVQLEIILSNGGSAYEVIQKQIDDNNSKGGYDLSERVSPVIKEQSEQALNENDLLQKAWQTCYARNPDYEKVVIKCQDFLEHFLRDTYEPLNTKPQLGKLIGNLKTASQKLQFKGSSVLSSKENILLLIDNIAQFRGLHTAGTGRIPKKEEAEFILHTTIYIWNIHQK